MCNSVVSLGLHTQIMGLSSLHHLFLHDFSSHSSHKRFLSHDFCLKSQDFRSPMPFHTSYDFVHLERKAMREKGLPPPPPHTYILFGLRDLVFQFLYSKWKSFSEIFSYVHSCCIHYIQLYDCSLSGTKPGEQSKKQTGREGISLHSPHLFLPILLERKIESKFPWCFFPFCAWCAVLGFDCPGVQAGRLEKNNNKIPVNSPLYPLYFQFWFLFPNSSAIIYFSESSDRLLYVSSSNQWEM